MLPVLDQPYQMGKFTNFLLDENESIECVVARFERDHWDLAKDSIKLSWPKRGIFYP